MRVYSRGQGTWGHDPIPLQYQNEVVPTYKFMTLHEPVTHEFGGHYHLSGAWGVHYYGPDQAAVCIDQERKRKDPEQYKNVKWHDIPGPNKWEPDSCDCGIHTQTLDYLREHQAFSADTLCQLDCKGSGTDYSDAGYRTSHGRVSKIWTSKNLDNDQLEKVKNDLGMDVETIPNAFKSNYGDADWKGFIDNNPHLSSWLPLEKKMTTEWDRRTAAESLDPNKDPDHIPDEYPCPKCGSDDLTLTPNPRGHKAGRLGTCNNCSHTWDRFND